MYWYSSLKTYVSFSTTNWEILLRVYTVMTEGIHIHSQRPPGCASERLLWRRREQRWIEQSRRFPYSFSNTFQQLFSSYFILSFSLYGGQEVTIVLLDDSVQQIGISQITLIMTEWTISYWIGDMEEIAKISRSNLFLILNSHQHIPEPWQSSCRKSKRTFHECWWNQEHNS